jgi:hypothetical protein
MRRLLLSVFVSIVVEGSVYAEDVSISTASQVDSTSTEDVKIVPPVRNWYVGVSVGDSKLVGFDPNALDKYYLSLGYRIDRTSGSSVSTNELDFYAGYRLRDFADIEMGYSRNTGWGESMTKFSDYIGTKRYLNQSIRAEEFYLSTSLRPVPLGYMHGLYLKLGGHRSGLNSSVSLNGGPVDLGVIGVADRVPGNGNYRGYGMLYGLGFDFRMPKGNAIRLEFVRHNNLGGTSYKKDSATVGYNKSF